MKCMDIVRNTLDYVDHKMPKKMKKKYEDLNESITCK